jgi:tetratricopeptide (TPR) repeat protein
MKKFLTVALIFAAALSLGADKKTEKNSEPFYRKYLAAGNPLDDKILEQEKRIAENPDNADLHNDMGNLLAARRFPHEARDQYEMAMKLDKHHFLAAYNLGMLYETQGEIGKAISAYEKSINSNRGFPPSRFRLGRLYEIQGSDQKAIEQYARALQIDPDMRDIKRNPLVVETRLLGLASLQNYQGDLARAAMASAAGYANTSLIKKLPVDRTLSSEDLKTLAAPAAAATPAPIQVIGPSSSAPPSRQPARPAPPVRYSPPPPPPEPAPDLVVPAEPAEEQPPPPPLPTADPTGSRPPYVGGAAAPRPTPTPG